MKRILPLLAILLFILGSCATYTTQTARQYMTASTDAPGTVKPTKLADIPQQAPPVPIVVEKPAPQEPKPVVTTPVLPQEPTPAPRKAPVYTLPAVSQMKLPYHHVTGADLHTVPQDLTLFSVLFIPFPATLTSQDIANLVPAVVNSIKDVQADIILVTGSPETTRLFAQEARMGAVIGEEGAIITDMAVSDITQSHASVTLAPEKTLSVGWKALGDSGVLQSIASGGKPSSWGKTVTDGAERRLAHVTEVTAALESTPAAPALFALSAFEPAHTDWTALTPRSWRSRYAWPLSASMKEGGWTDAYAMTHYSGETHAGPTWALGDKNVIEERVDFLYVKNLMSVETTVLHLGTLSIPTADTPARMGVYGTFIAP